MKIFARIIDLRFIELASNGGVLPIFRYVDGVTGTIEVNTFWGPFALKAGEYEFVIFEK